MCKRRGWKVKKTHGSKFSDGWPDLYLTHSIHKVRWVEVKVKGKIRFTKAQLREFPQFMNNGTDIWIVTEASEEQYQMVVHGKPNCKEVMEGLKNATDKRNKRQNSKRN